MRGCGEEYDGREGGHEYAGHRGASWGALRGVRAPSRVGALAPDVSRFRAAAWRSSGFPATTCSGRRARSACSRTTVEGDRLGLRGAGLEHHHPRTGLCRGPLEVGEHRARHPGPPGLRGDVHPLDLGRLGAAERLDVAASAPGAGGDRDVVRRSRRRSCRPAARTSAGRAGCRRGRRSARRTPPGRPRSAAARPGGRTRPARCAARVTQWARLTASSGTTTRPDGRLLHDDAPIPADLLPADGRFGAGPSKIQTSHLDALAATGSS